MSYDWELIGIMARASLLLTIAGIGVWCLSRWKPLAHPGWHRLAWGAALLQGLMLFPMSLQVTLPSWWPARMGVAQSQVTNASDSDSRGEDLLEPGPLPSWSEPSPIFPQQSATPSSIFAAIPEVMSGNEHAGQSRPSPHGVRLDRDSRSVYRGFTPIPLPTWLIIIWALGFVVVVASLARNYRCLQIALAACQPAREHWAIEMQSLCQELQLDHYVPLDVHPELGPFLCWTPRGTRVVVPVRLWNRLSRQERIAVLHHELCHLRRGDLWKALLARIVVAMHWFNPMAWISARRFDESAEWACDSRMAAESPIRTTLLARALLTASQAGQASPSLALSATGGPLFQRVRRLINSESSGDTIVKKAVWIGIVMAVVAVGAFRLEWQLPALVAQETDPKAGTIPAATPSDDEQPQSNSSEKLDPDKATASASVENSRLTDYTARIVVGDNDSLKKFVALTKTSTGNIVMADRAALAAQEAANSADPASQWQQFTDKAFERKNDRWVVRGDFIEVLSEYRRNVKTGLRDIEPIAAVFREVAPQLIGKPEIAPVLRRFLTHEAAPAFVYHTELRARLHPGMNQLEERFQEHLVRTRARSYVIRPTRRAQVEKRLEFFAKLQGPLGRFEKELAAWSEDLVKGDELHGRFAATLRMPAFARYIVFDHIAEDSKLSDEELDGMFSSLEDATAETAVGLKLNPDADSFKEMQSRMDRFHLVWDNRDSLAEPLKQLTERIETSDELHERLKTFLQTELALMFVARDMDYLPVDPEEAAREWLAQMVTKNEAGKYEITVESAEDLSNRLEEFFREFRDIRRRGRVVDEFARQLADAELNVAMESLIGKLLLARLVESAQERPEVDGLVVWFENHFQETPEGLVLNDWTGEVINQILSEAEEIEKELAKQDF